MAKIKQFALDSVSNYFNMFMKIGIYFISVPICLDVYGKGLYGVFLLTFGLANSFMFFDFGIANSLIRYASAYKRTKEIKQFSEEVLIEPLPSSIHQHIENYKKSNYFGVKKN